MNGDDFDAIFSGRPAGRPGFTERVARPTGMASPETGASEDGLGHYKPFGFLPTGNIGECCDVQRWIDGTETAEGIEFQYRFLMQVGYVGDEQLKLFLPDCIVVIEGMRLRELRKKLARRQVTFIQQFSPLIWPRPNAGEIIVERIAMMRP